MTSPGLHGLPGCPVQLWSRTEYCALEAPAVSSIRRQARNVASLASRYPPGAPDIRTFRRGFRSRGHLRVNAHHATSSRKLLPSPLSPVMRFSRLCRSSTISGAGPTFSNSRRSSIRFRSYSVRCRWKCIRTVPGMGESIRHASGRSAQTRASARNKSAATAILRSTYTAIPSEYPNPRTWQFLSMLRRRALVATSSGSRSS